MEEGVAEEAAEDRHADGGQREREAEMQEAALGLGHDGLPGDRFQAPPDSGSDCRRCPGAE